MTNRSKAKGTAFETLVATYLQNNWDDRIERRTLSGALDKGDIANLRVNGFRIAVECKDEATYNFAGALSEAQQEALNDQALIGVAVVKRHRKARPEDQFVVLALGD